jgi:hypothetical protein
MPVSEVIVANDGTTNPRNTIWEESPPPNMGMVNNGILFSLSMIMNQKLERYVVWTLAIILIVIGLSGCSYPYAPLGN